MYIYIRCFDLVYGTARAGGVKPFLCMVISSRGGGEGRGNWLVECFTIYGSCHSFVGLVYVRFGVRLFCVVLG